MLRARLLLTVVLIASTGTGCSLDPPQMPSWDVTLSLPVVTEEYSFRDLAEDEDFLTVVGDSLEIRVQEPITDLDFEGRLTVDAYSADFSVSLGSFKVDSISAGHVAFTLGELWDNAPGSTVWMEVTPFCFPDAGAMPLSRVIDMGDAYEYIEFSRGTLLVTVRNGSAVSLGHPTGGCPLRIIVTSGVDYTDSCVVGGPVGPNDEITFELDLAGSRLNREIEVTISGGSAGSDGPVEVSPDDELQISVMPVDVRAARALARIPEQSFSDTSTIVIGDSTRIVTAEIASGCAEFTLANRLPVPLTLNVETENLTIDGTPLAVAMRINALSDSSVSIDLAGYRVETQPVCGDTLEGTNEIDFDVTAEIQEPEGLLALSSNDTVAVDVELSGMVLRRVTGTLKPTVVTFSEESVLDFPEGFECINPSYAALIINITNSAEVGGGFILDVEGRRGTTTREARFHGVIEAAHCEGVSQTTRCEFDGEDALHLVGIFPEVVHIDGEATVSGRGTISSRDSLHGDFEMVVPMAFEVRADTFTTEVRRSDIDKGVRESLEEDVKESRFSGRVVTGAPLSGGVRLFMGADSATVYSEPLLVLPGDGSSIGFDGTDEAGSRPADFEVGLTADDLRVFMRDHVWFGLEIGLNPSQAPVTLRPGEAVHIEGRIELVRRVGS